jgi:DNA repair protein RecN (Recombination protein N)
VLRELRIRNLAVIEAVTVPFGPGLNVLTGETGAGKSILMDAILLVGGARAQTDVIRSGAETATVEACFEVPPRGPAALLLEASGVPVEDDQLVVRRELHRSGRHRAFVNDAAVSVGLLDRLGECLVEIHGQHEYQRLLEPERQLALLDRFAGLDEARERVAELHAKDRAARQALERARLTERERAERLDLLRSQIGELDAARPVPGEEEALRAERRRLQHAQRLLAGLEEVGALLRDGDGAAADRLGRAARVLRDLGRLDPACGAPAEAVEAALAQLDEALLAARRLREGLAVEPERLLAIDERLDILTRLKRKYGDSEEAMLAFRETAARELARLEHHAEAMAADARRAQELQGELLAAAAALGRARRAAAERLAGLVQRELRTLGMERARFAVAVEALPPEEVTPRGLDRVEFRFSANPGEELRPLARIASGGELSRTMLAVQVVLAADDRVPTMVFDEVDAGVGASAAAAVADRLARVAAGRQVLCVTHLAPVAARADHHLVVTKDVRGGRTRAAVGVLGEAEREAEVARLLGGDAGSATARRHARELLAARRRARPR